MHSHCQRLCHTQNNNTTLSMNLSDTIDLSTLPFYQWDSVLSANPQSSGFAGIEMIDSVFCKHPEMEIISRPSMFEGHSLAVEHSQMVPRENPASPAWIFVILLLLAGLLTMYYRNHKLTFGGIISSLFNLRTMNRMLRSNNILRTSQFALIPAVATGCIAMFAHQVAMESTGIVGFLLLWVGLFVGYYLRFGLMRLLAIIFENENGVSLYITSSYLFHLLLSTLLIPMLLLLIYLPWGTITLEYIMIGVVALEILLRVLRGFQLFLTNSNSSRFFLFYYLCVVEIAPILVLIKWIIE